MWRLAEWNWALDGWIVAAGILCAIACALLGNFLVLRRMSMLGDAISHAVLPGLAAAFLISGSRNSLPMFIGAVIVGLLTAVFTEWIRGVGKVDEGASMGVVFTSLFALGLVLIVQAADSIDLDPNCVLYGVIEASVLDTIPIGGLEVPRVVCMLSIIVLLNTSFVVLFFKELKISSFDPALATTSGFNASLMHYLLMILVAVTAVASFETVGNVLVVAMLVVPAAAAYMLTDRLVWMIILSVILATLSAITGHVGAIVVPSWFGYRSTNTAGMMAVAAGIILILAITFGPKHGVLIKFVRRHLLSWGILTDDIIALLYRIDERGEITKPNAENLKIILFSKTWAVKFVLAWLRWRQDVTHSNGVYHLTPKGTIRAEGLVRSHRLWEHYLVSEAGVDPDRIHDKAERFEHFTDDKLREQLDTETDRPQIDPHGRPIPEKRTDPKSDEK